MSRKREPDVCLLLEGTYPFVKGGVSSWVHQLVLKLPHLTFTIIHISPKKGYYDGPVYEMPENVVGLDEIYLHDYTMPEDGRREEIREKVERFRAMVNDMREGKIEAFTGFIESLDSGEAGQMNSFDLLQTKESWDVLIETYRKEAVEVSFLNFF